MVGSSGFLCVVFLISLNTVSAAKPESFKPDPGLTPHEVIKIQLAALQNNDESDSGIEITFRFASPSNKRVTGPLPRFVQMLKSPGYRALLNYKKASFSTLTVTGREARQRVSLTDRDGAVVIYTFILFKQTEEPYKNCWMTDGVLREEAPPRNVAQNISVQRDLTGA